jgi:hypothetical protein
MVLSSSSAQMSKVVPSRRLSSRSRRMPGGGESSFSHQTGSSGVIPKDIIDERRDQSTRTRNPLGTGDELITSFPWQAALAAVASTSSDQLE